jgi:large subunit ribosomal protein L6
MSRIGKYPVQVPSGTDVKISGQQVTAKGKLGQASLDIVDDISVSIEGDKVWLKPKSDGDKGRTMWGTSRTLVLNLINGVSTGFTRNLEINGVGYRAAVEGKALKLQLGFSHDVLYPIPEGIAIKCDRPTAIAISGTDKQRVGQVAAEIRAYRPPEPYKGKGIKYAEEVIFRKEGKKK